MSSAIGITCPEDLFELDANDLSCPQTEAQAVAVQTPPIAIIIDTGRDDQGETQRELADGVRKAQPVAETALISSVPNCTAEEVPCSTIESSLVSPIVIQHEPMAVAPVRSREPDATRSSTSSRHIIIAKCKSLRRAIRYNSS